MPLRLRAPVLLTCDVVCSVVRDAVVDIAADGRIAYAGAERDAPGWNGAVRGLTGILMPGLVNTHAHTPMSLLRGRGGDLPLTDWLRNAMWPAEGMMAAGDTRAGMMLGSIEMLRRGVTTSTEMYVHTDEMIEAVAATGARAVLTEAILAGPAGASWEASVADIGNRIDKLGLVTGPGGRIELGYGPHSAYELPLQALRAIGEEAHRRGALVHIHVAETVGEDRPQRAAFGSVPQLLDHVGLTQGRLLAAHGVHLDPRDIALFAEAGTGVAHCPSSNAKLAAGVAPVVELREAGVRVGLGTDGPASNDRLDLLEEARSAALLARMHGGDPAAMSAVDALMLATRGGAEALGRDDIGTVERGRFADVVHVSVDDPAFATGLDVPDDELIANLVWAAGSRTVTDVWVAGERVVEAGEPARVDREAVGSQVAAAAARLRVPAVAAR
ncbi:amidohydrolase [Actinoplanes sp. TBRC 11911]|nr:amidohydrolase [Actinoplanes sp. TBRC 11911]